MRYFCTMGQHDLTRAFSTQSFPYRVAIARALFNDWLEDAPQSRGRFWSVAKRYLKPTKVRNLRRFPDEGQVLLIARGLRYAPIAAVVGDVFLEARGHLVDELAAAEPSEDGATLKEQWSAAESVADERGIDPAEAWVALQLGGVGLDGPTSETETATRLPAVPEDSEGPEVTDEPLPEPLERWLAEARQLPPDHPAWAHIQEFSAVLEILAGDARDERELRARLAPHQPLLDYLSIRLDEIEHRPIDVEGLVDMLNELSRLREAASASTLEEERTRHQQVSDLGESIRALFEDPDEPALAPEQRARHSDPDTGRVTSAPEAIVTSQEAAAGPPAPVTAETRAAENSLDPDRPPEEREARAPAEAEAPPPSEPALDPETQPEAKPLDIAPTPTGPIANLAETEPVVEPEPPPDLDEGTTPSTDGALEPEAAPGPHPRDAAPERCRTVTEFINRLRATLDVSAAERAALAQVAEGRPTDALLLVGAAAAAGVEVHAWLDPLLRALILAPEAGRSGPVADALDEQLNELWNFAGELSPLGVEAESRWLLLFAAALVPAVVNPRGFAPGLLDMIPFEGQLAAFKALRDAIRPLAADDGLTTHLLSGMCDEAEHEKQIAAAAANAHEWLAHRRKATIKFQAASEVWRQWIDRGPLAQALEITADNRRGDREAALAAIDSWRDRKYVESEIDKTHVSRPRRHKRRIEGNARITLRDLASEAVALVDRWAGLVGSSNGDDGRERVKKLWPPLREALEVARVVLDEWSETRSSVVERAAHAAASRALDDLRDLFKGRELSGNANPMRLLYPDAPHVPGLELTESGAPVHGPETANDVFDFCTAPARDVRRSIDVQLAQGHHRAVDALLELAERTGDISGDELQQIRERCDDALQDAQEGFDHRRRRLEIRIERALIHGLFPETTLRDRLVGDLAAIADRPVDFAAANRALDEIERELGEAREAAFWEVHRSTNRDELDDAVREAFDEALEREDVHTAREYIANPELVRTARGIADVNRFEAFFPSFVHTLESAGPLSPQVVSAIRDGGSERPEWCPELDVKWKEQAADGLDSWLKLLRSRPQEKLAADSLGRIITAVGFGGVAVEATEHRDGCWEGRVHTAPVRGRDRCPLPHWASRANGEYRLVVFWPRTREEDLVQHLKDLGDGSPLLVLWLDRASVNQRRQLARRLRKDHVEAVVVDEALFTFLCTRGEPPLSLLFECALPFTVGRPYITMAGLVPPEMFFGREKERRSILRPDGTNLVFGGRQLGKTALLRNVERRYHDPDDGWVVRYMDLKAEGIGANRDISDIWQVLASKLRESGVLKGGVTRQATIAAEIREWLSASPRRRILLLLDEADAFLEGDAREGKYGQVSMLKGLMDDTERRFKVVFAGLHNVQRTSRSVNSPLAHLGEPVCIGPLGEEPRAALELVRSPFRALGYDFQHDDLPVRVLSHANWYPSLVQIFCKHLLEHMEHRSFPIATSPPYRLTAQDIEDAYSNESLRDEVRKRFLWTLDLDPRYRAIALSIALASRDGEPPDVVGQGVDVSWVRDEMVALWPQGFAGATTHEDLRAILDEMVGLGVLRRMDRGRYALRSANILGLLGTYDEIEGMLLSTFEREPPVAYDPESFRRPDPSHEWRRSPLTFHQESVILDEKPGVSVVFGTRASGVADVGPFLKMAVAQKTGDPARLREIEVGRASDLHSFQSRLDEIYTKRSDGLNVILVSAHVPWARPWVEIAWERVRRAKKAILKIVFVGDAEAAWTWSRHKEPPGRVTELGLRPWKEAAWRRWLEGLQVPESSADIRKAEELTGGLTALVEQMWVTHGDPRQRDLPGRLEAVARDPDWPDRVREQLQVPEPTLEVLRALGTTLETAEGIALLTDGVDGNTVRRVLRWGQLVHLLAPAEKEGDVYFRLLPLVARHLELQTLPG